MASKLFCSVLASVLLVQAAYSQCLGSIGNLGYGSNIIGTGPILNNNLNNLALGALDVIPTGYIGNGINVIGNNYGYVPGVLGGAEIISTGINLGGYNGQFSISSGSPVYEYPGGVVINSENQIGGHVTVTGATPFYGAAYYGGDVASAGEASLVYNAGPSVSLNGGGCGYGLGGAGNYNTGVAGTSVGVVTPGVGLGGVVAPGVGLGGVVNNGFGGIVSNGLGGVIGGTTCTCANNGLWY